MNLTRHLPNPRRYGTPIALLVALVLVVHLGLAGYAATHWRLSLGALAAMSSVIAGKLLLIGLSRAGRHRRWRRSRTPADGNPAT